MIKDIIKYEEAEVTYKNKEDLSSNELYINKFLKTNRVIVNATTPFLYLL